MKKLLFIYFFAAVSTANAADRWWEIRISGEPSGYQHMTTETLADGTIRTTNEQVIVINRLGSVFILKTKLNTIESPTGELISAREEVKQSDQTVVTEAEIKADEIQVHSSTGAGSYNRSVPNKGSICGPAYYARLTRDSLQKIGDSVKCRLYEPSSGPVRSTRTLVGEDDVAGKRFLRVMVKSGDRETGPIWLFDNEGLVFENERDLAGTKLATRATDEETALRAAKVTGPRDEFFDHTAARSNFRFVDARAVEHATLRITHRKPSLGWPAFEAPSQKTVEKTPSSLILEIKRPELSQSPADAPPTAPTDAARYLKPNQYLQSDDPEVIRLAREVAGEEHDLFKAARKLHDWVASNMMFDTGIALTPASEVVRNRRGTCGAYAVLLASMARAIAIPSRVAMGYIYAAGIWGPHAWTEVFVENQWIPLDSAGYRRGIADAARFQFGSYTLEDNAAAFNFAGSQMYGNIDIEVLEYSIAGQTFPVSLSAPKYSVLADQYRNSSLGFSVRKPEGFEFQKLDAVYPDFTILKMEHGSAQVSVKLLEVFPELRTLLALNEISPEAKPTAGKLDGRDAIVVSAAGKARLISRQGESVWMITAEGNDAVGLLERVVGGWKWLAE